MSKEFGDRLKSYLSKWGDQTRLAEYLGVEPQSVQQWCAGKTEPERDKIPGIAAYIGISEMELMFGKKPYKENDTTNNLTASQTTEEYLQPNSTSPQQQVGIEEIDDLLKSIGTDLKSATLNQLLVIKKILEMRDENVSKTDGIIELLERFIREISRRQ